MAEEANRLLIDDGDGGVKNVQELEVELDLLLRVDFDEKASGHVT